jgi:hypothetical protein
MCTKKSHLFNLFTNDQSIYEEQMINSFLLQERKEKQKT